MDVAEVEEVGREVLVRQGELDLVGALLLPLPAVEEKVGLVDVEAEVLIARDGEPVAGNVRVLADVLAVHEVHGRLARGVPRAGPIRL